jgi:K+-transporting ATPase ATPase A chain
VPVVHATIRPISHLGMPSAAASTICARVRISDLLTHADGWLCADCGNDADVFGGEGVGLINLITFAILTVFLVGMMIGRTPEFLGKKIEAREMKLVMIAVPVHPLSILGLTALAAMMPATLASLSNMGPHDFREILYAYASGTANNASAFGGLNADTPFFNTTIGFAMLIDRYLTLLPMLGVAGLLAAKKTIPEGIGTLSTSTPIFTGLLVFVVQVVGGLTFLPSLALGPIADQQAWLYGAGPVAGVLAAALVSPFLGQAGATPAF